MVNEILEAASEAVGSVASTYLGLDLETAKIVGVMLVGLHLLTHEVPILVLGVMGFLKLFRRRQSTIIVNGCRSCDEQR
jgi:hypothetical protein